MVAFGAVAWSWGWLQAGVMPEGVNDQVEIWMSGLFQIGLIALLAVMRATDATGTTRFGRFVLNAEVVAVALAMAWTIPFLFDANRPNTGILVVLDAFWPLSMVGLVVVGIVVARAGRWPSPARYLPLAASLLIPVDIALMAAGLGLEAQNVVRSAYLTLAYAALGVAIIRQVAPLAERHQPDPEPVGATIG
jgi:hypothetical protein